MTNLVILVAGLLLLTGCVTSLKDKCVFVEVGDNGSFTMQAATFATLHLEGPAVWRSYVPGSTGQGCGGMS